MKILKKIVLSSILVSSLSARSNYCIQVAEIYSFDENHIDPTVERIINNFDKARIDRRGRHLILRVGDYKGYSEALRDLSKLKTPKFPDAFIRRCDYIESKIVYPKHNKKREQYKVEEIKQDDQLDFKEFPEIKEEKVEINTNKPEPKLEPKEEVIEVYETPKKPKESKEYKYNKNGNYSYDFWQECKKCYAPLEDEQNYKKVVKKDVVKKEIIEKDNFFEKHSKVKTVKPKLKESDSFFGGKFNFDEKPVEKKNDLVKPKEEKIDIVDDLESDIKNNAKKEDDDTDDFFNMLDDDTQDNTVTQDKEIQNTPKEEKPIEVKETPKEDTTNNKEETDDLYDMFGIDDL